MKTLSKRRLILASTSPRRAELLSTLQLPFEVMPSHADEVTPVDWTPDRIVTELAVRKANAVYQSLDPAQRDAVIIGSDTIVVRDKTVLGKPKDAPEAAQMLRTLQGRSHTVFTGVACVDGLTGQSKVEYRITTVTMKPLTEDGILKYASSGEGLDKAGAYGIQGYGATLVTSIEGCYFNVVGLPISLLSDMLKDFGVDVL